MDNTRLAQQAMENPAGWKRPLWWLKGKLAPVPWVGGQFPRLNEWKRVQVDRAIAVENYKLCLMCGEGFDTVKDWDDRVYALIEGMFASDETGITPSPTHGHASCILKAVTFCPHLVQYEYPACDADGIKLNREDLKRLAKGQQHG